MTLNTSILYSITLTLMIMPGLIWLEHTGDISLYFSKSAPKGQLFYVLSKLFGMYAMTFLIWQVISVFMTRLGLFVFTEKKKTHVLLGFFSFFLVLIHIALFFVAVSAKQGSFAWTLLLPNFKDYYHSYLAFGLIGLGALIIQIITGIIRLRHKNAFVKKLHNINIFVMLCVYIHAFTIGSETQTQKGFVFYLFLTGIALLLWLVSFIRLLKLRFVLS